LNKENKRVNTIIEIRKQILEMLHSLCTDIDNEFYKSKERSIIKKDVVEIAEMVRDKDMYMKALDNFGNKCKKDNSQNTKNIKDIRSRVIALLHQKNDSIVATQYDNEEFGIISSELKDLEKMIMVKDKLLLDTNVQLVNDKKLKKVNPFISKFFKMDAGPCK